MKRAIFIILFCTFSALLISPVSSSNEFRAVNVVDELKHGSTKVGAYRALIIAIKDYQDPKIPNLETPLNDAHALADLLQQKYGFVVETILGKQATRKVIYNSLRSLSSKAKPNDSFLIYYAGHGDFDRQYNDGWWIPYDAKAGDPLTYLDNVQVQKAMRSMKARHVLLISDSCYSGTLFGQSRAMPPVIDNKYYLNLYNEKSRWGMTSGNKTPVADNGTGRHSIFAYQLIKELTKNDKPYLSTQEIYTRIAPIVSNNSEQTPLCRPIRNTGDRGGEFVFIASSSAMIEILSSGIKDKAKVSIESNVTEARVFVDGHPIGTTPLSDIEVSEGEHRILVEKQGYDTYQKKIHIIGGRSMSLFVDLSKKGPMKGRLYVETEPENARVSFLSYGYKFYQGIDLDPGRYQIEVSAWGYKTENKWVALNAGEDKYLNINLIKRSKVSSGYKVQNPPKSIGSEFVNTPPDILLMNSPYEHKKGIVKFTHKMHSDRYSTTCGACHHDENNKPLNNLKKGDDVQKCIVCHSRPGEVPKTIKIEWKVNKLAKKEKDKLSRQWHAEAVHDNCRDCHKTYNKKNKTKAAPTTCIKCHPKIRN
jgi:caspase domain-containing protein/PEGA domain-containing protein/class III cytochrome C family protein